MASPGNKDRQTRVDFGKKLVGYAAAAGATLAMGAPAAQAAPIVVDPVDIVLQGPFSGTPIDMNNDSLNDFYFYVSTNGPTFSQGSYAYQVGYPYPGARIAGELQNVYYATGSAAFTYPFARNTGFGAIVSTALFTTSAFMLGYAGYYGTAAGGPLGNFAGNRGFLGVSFLDAALAQHFGWIDISASSDLHQLTIHRWAYERDPDTPIETPQTPVPESGSLALLAMGAAGLAAWRRSKSTRQSGNAT